MNYNDTQEPDTQPGSYYVSAADGDRIWLMLGPFENDHKAALEAVKAVKDYCVKREPYSYFYAWGTCRLPAGSEKQGHANNCLLNLLPRS